MKVNRRHFTAAVAAGLAAPALIRRTAHAQPKPGDELVVGIWGGAQEKIVKAHIEPKLVDKYGCTVSYVLGGTGDRRARAHDPGGGP